jgi:hypothetical protein
MSQPGVAPSGGTQPRQRPLITDARQPASAEMTSRIRRYTLTMAFRTACFISMVFVSGPLRWVLFAGAVVLPYVAVIFANQANRRGQFAQLGPPPPQDHPALTVGDHEIVESEAAEHRVR